MGRTVLLPSEWPGLATFCLLSYKEALSYKEVDIYTYQQTGKHVYDYYALQSDTENLFLIKYFFIGTNAAPSSKTLK